MKSETLKDKIEKLKASIASPKTAPEFKSRQQEMLVKLEKHLEEALAEEAEEEAEKAKKNDAEKAEAQKAEEEAARKQKEKKDSLEARVSKIKSCVPNLEEARNTLNAWHAKQNASKPATPAVKRPITKIFVEKISSAFSTVFNRESTFEKVDKINVKKIEEAKGNFITGIKNLRAGFSGLKGEGFVQEFEKNFDDLIQKINDKKKQLEEQE